jgi:hypothetical protein
MLYFAVALLSLLAAETMMSAGVGFPAEALRAPATLVVVHLVTIGWLSLRPVHSGADRTTAP